MNILPFQLESTNDLLTSHAGLVCIAEVMKSLDFSNLVDQHFPAPGSNRGFKPSVFINSLVLMLHGGGECLDDLCLLRDDAALRLLLGLKHVPQADSAGNWLRRQGQRGVSAIHNRILVTTLLEHDSFIEKNNGASQLNPNTNQSTVTFSSKSGFGIYPTINK